MPKLSNFPDGFPGGVEIRGIPVLNTYWGNVFWVDSGTGSNGNKGTYKRPFADLDYAVGRCTANNGDLIILAPGHTETLIADSAVDIDVAGVSVLGLGTGADRPSFTFTTDVAADFKLAANNVTIKNLLFLAGIDALTGPIEVSADDCAIIGCEYRDDDTNNYETTDVLVTASTPLRMLIDGFRYVHDGGSGGTQNQSVIQLNGADKAVIRNCWLVADSGTGVIEDATTSDQILIENCIVENTETSPTVTMLLQATTTGTVVHSMFRVASGTTYFTAANDMQFFESFGTGTDATSGEKVATILSGDIEAKLDVVDGYHDVPTADVTTNSQMRDVVGNKTDAAAAGAVSSTESLMAYLKQLVTELQIVDEFHDVPGADNVLNAQINEVIGNKSDAAATGAVTATDTLVGYIKQLVTELAVIDEFHDVPAADATANSQMNEVVGNKTDAAATGAVSTTESLMAFLKQVVTEIQLPSGDTTANTLMSEVIGNKSDSGAQADSSTRSLMSRIKGVADVLWGSSGVASYPAAAAPANGVSLAEVLRAIYDRQLGDGTDSSTNSQLGKKVTRAAADVFDGATTALFTVSTGRVLMTHLEGEVTGAAIDAGASNLKFVSNPTVGTDRDLCAVRDINADELGTIFTITGSVADAVSGGSGGGAQGMTIRGVVVPEGTIDVNTTADVGTGGAQGKFELWYIPLDDGATVASA